ncbi:helix-turn-helix domain-containing protein [Chryseolinea soli]|uniref:DNA-binding protein n=1 Tax=Chryseolinea soli TaxID=2321403 RepID=A0A385SSZ6_9BACT|nr:DNA-binding protein [Chryseolinea soli]
MNSQGKTHNPFEAIENQLSRIESLLLELKSDRHSFLVNKSIETNNDNGIKLAMRITGWKRKTIYNLVCKRMIPHFKRGKTLYFDEQELKDWIKAGKRLTQEEAEKLA